MASGDILYAQNQNQSVQQFKKPKNNKKKIKANKRKNRGRKGEKATRKDIAGKKLRRNTTPRQTYARPQPSPYVGRKNYGQADRPAAQPPPNFRKPPGNDKPRSKDITGRRVKPRQSSTGRRQVYSSSGASQRSKRRSESSIARNAGKYSTRPQSASRPSERAKVTVGGLPPSRSGRLSVRKAKNPYRGKYQRDGEKGSSKDIAGRKLRTRNAVSPSPRPRRGYRTPDTYFGRKSKGDRPSFSSKRMTPAQFRSASRPGETSTDQTAKGSAPGFKNYRSSKPQFKSEKQSPYAGKKQRKEGEFFQDTKPKRVRSISAKVKAKNVLSVQIFPKSASQQRKDVVRSKSPYKGRYQRDGEKGSSKDIAGRKQRTKGFVSPRPNWEKAVGKNDIYYGRKFRGDQPAAPISGGFNSSKRGRWNNQGRAMPSRAPLNSQIRANKFQGNVRARKPLKGGGTTSRKQWNNQGFAIPTRGPSQETSKATGFKGRFKAFQIQPSFNDEYINYQGNMKARKPLKGGGTTSRKQWNNMGNAIPSRGPSSETSKATQFRGRFKSFQIQPTFNDEYVGYQGNIKARKPVKGAGGTKSRGQWNNNFQPLEGRGPTRSGLQASRYQGNLRAKRPVKGAGGSLKRGRWNNNNQAIEGRGPSSTGLQASRYQGNLRAKRPAKGGGGSLERGNWNNNNQAIEGRGPSRTGLMASRYQGNIKSRGKPTISRDAKKAARYQGNVKETRVNPLQKTAAFFTRKDIRPRTKPADGLDYGRTKTFLFIPNSKVNNYGGFVKAEFKSNKKNWHPSSKYADKSSTEEKDKVFKFKIWWASLFNKNESLPQSVKKEEKRPRYSKDESKIWYE